MKDSNERILCWMPRILSILFAAFISIFALDVLGTGDSRGETILAFLIHLIPTALVLVALVIAWRWERMGAILFAALGSWYIIMAWGDMHWTAYFFISGPLFLIAALFLAHWLYRRDAAALV